MRAPLSNCFVVAYLTVQFVDEAVSIYVNNLISNLQEPEK